MRRDPKGIYGKARRGEISNVPGIQAVYEPPENPDLVIRGDRDDPVAAVQRIISLLIQKGYAETSIL
jgi:adenylylsulfate kinase-like enzyme